MNLRNDQSFSNASRTGGQKTFTISEALADLLDELSAVPVGTGNPDGKTQQGGVS